MNEKTIARLKEDLNTVISTLCLDSYLNFNKKKDGTFYKKHRQYTVPVDAEIGVELLALLSQSVISNETEELIKSFLLPYKLGIKGI